MLTKPVTPSTLLEAIGEALGKGLSPRPGPSERADSHGEAMAQLRGARVLLVEDNDMNQELAIELLRQAGHRRSWSPTTGRRRWNPGAGRRASTAC